MKELQSDSKWIFEHLQKDSEILEVTKSSNFDLNGAVGEALDAIHHFSGDAPMADDSCLVIAVIVQWVVRYVTKHLMHLLTPEALILNAKQLPKSLMKAYFEFQEHFCLKELINCQLHKMKINN